MTCNACGDKPKKTCDGFTKAVIEIDNPETLVLLRKVVIPASMGTEEDVPAAIGKYHNVILHYEANKHTYLYSSDGIPTLLEMEIPQELLDRIEELEENLAQETATREDADEELQANIDAVAQDLEDFKNSPDVVDIVPTYAALQAYDTSSLSNNDEIRVLADETRDGASSYYRWDKTNSQWIFIGITGPYYTKSEIDTTVSRIEDEIDNIDIPDVVQTSGTSTEDVMSQKATTDFVNTSMLTANARVLTEDDYNWPVDNPDGVAIWLLDVGTYRGNVKKYVNINTFIPEDFIIIKLSNYNQWQYNIMIAPGRSTGGYGNWYRPKVYVTHPNGTEYTISGSDGLMLVRGDVVQTPSSGDIGYMYKALSAYSGYFINKRITDTMGLSKTLTSNDYNWNSTTHSATAPYDSIALWLLPSGQYHIDDNSMKVFTSIAATELSFPNQHMYLINKESNANTTILVTPYSAATPQTRFTFYVTSIASGQPSGGTTVNGMTIPWGDIPTVVQTTGNSTTSVMSQKAVRDLIYTPSFNPDEKNNIRIGYQASSYNNSVAIGNQANFGRTNSNVVAIGNNAYGPSNGEESIAIGHSANADASCSICIGNNAYTNKKGCIMLGAWSSWNAADGIMYIGTSNTTYGYNNSGYRLLTGLYDPQNAHDAATKGYVDNNIPATFTTNEWNALWA